MGCTSHAPRRSETAVCSGVRGGVSDGRGGGIGVAMGEGGRGVDGIIALGKDGYLGVRGHVTCKAA